MAQEQFDFSFQNQHPGFQNQHPGAPATQPMTMDTSPRPPAMAPSQQNANQALAFPTMQVPNPGQASPQPQPMTLSVNGQMQQQVNYGTVPQLQPVPMGLQPVTTMPIDAYKQQPMQSGMLPMPSAYNNNGIAPVSAEQQAAIDAEYHRQGERYQNVGGRNDNSIRWGLVAVPVIILLCVLGYVLFIYCIVARPSSNSYRYKSNSSYSYSSGGGYSNYKPRRYDSHTGQYY